MTLHYWTVRVSIPQHGVNSQGTPYTTHQQEAYGVIAETLQDAVTRILSETPNVVIWAVNHHGKVTHSYGSSQ